MRELTRLFLLTTAIACSGGCILTGDSDPLEDGAVVDDQRFDANCSVMGGPVVLPNDRARLDSVIDKSDCLRIDGNLSIRGDVDSLGRFEELNEIRVSGGVVVSGTTKWTDLTALRGLTRIEGDLVIEETEELESTEGLLRLQRVMGDFRVARNADLRLVHGPKNLRQIGADLIVEDNPVVCDLTGFDGLEYIAEYDDRADRPEGAGEFGSVDPEFRTDGVIDPHIIITDNPQLKRIEGFASLTDIDGDIRLERNDELVTVRGFEQLEYMTGRLVIRDQPFLQKIDALVRPSCLREVILENTGVTDFTAFSEVWEIGRLELVANDGLAGLGGFRDELRLRGPVIVSGNASLRSMNGLGAVTSIDMDRDRDSQVPAQYRDTPNARCVAVGFDNDDDADLVIEENDALEELGLENLERVGGGLVVRGNDILTDLDGLSNVRRAFGDILIESNASLTRIDGFAELTRLFHDVRVTDNEQLTSLNGFAGLEDLGGDLVIRANPALESIDGFRSLEKVEALELANLGVVDLDGFAALQQADSLEFVDNAAIGELVDFGSLRTVDGDLRIERNDELVAVRFDRLNSVDGIVVQNNPKLSQCQAEALVDQVFSPDFSVVEDNAACE